MIVRRGERSQLKPILQAMAALRCSRQAGMMNVSSCDRYQTIIITGSERTATEAKMKLPKLNSTHKSTEDVPEIFPIPNFHLSGKGFVMDCTSVVDQILHHFTHHRFRVFFQTFKEVFWILFNCIHSIMERSDVHSLNDLVRELLQVKKFY